MPDSRTPLPPSKVWLIGTGDFASLCVERFQQAFGEDGLRIYTAHPTLANRGKETPSPVETRALELGFKMGIDLFRVGSLSKDEAFLAALEEEKPDVVFVVDFGQIVREPLLSAPRHGCLNIHPSLLPKWRGAAPIQRALMSGDREIGVTVFRLVPEMDAGPILAQQKVPVPQFGTASKAYRILSEVGCALAMFVVVALEEGNAQSREQDHSLATYAAKLSREEFEVFWDWPALKVHNFVRALNMSGGAFITLGDKRLKLWSVLSTAGDGAPGTVLGVDAEGVTVACGVGAIRLLEVQAEGKRKMSASDWARGSRVEPGQILN